MSHYHIQIGVDAEEVKIIKRDFDRFIKESDGFAISLFPDNEVENSEELQDTIKTLFARLLVIVANADFIGLN